MILVHLAIGTLAAAVLLGLIELARRQRLTVPIWGWILTALGLAYLVFTLEVLVSLLAEGAPQAALVSGLVLGLIAAIWAVLLGRYVFSHRLVAAQKELSHG